VGGGGGVVVKVKVKNWLGHKHAKNHGHAQAYQKHSKNTTSDVFFTMWNSFDVIGCSAQRTRKFVPPTVYHTMQ
jgi:hypothetical protein